MVTSCSRHSCNPIPPVVGTAHDPRACTRADPFRWRSDRGAGHRPGAHWTLGTASARKPARRPGRGRQRVRGVNDRNDHTPGSGGGQGGQRSGPIRVLSLHVVSTLAGGLVLGLAVWSLRLGVAVIAPQVTYFLERTGTALPGAGVMFGTRLDRAQSLPRTITRVCCPCCGTYCSACPSTPGHCQAGCSYTGYTWTCCPSGGKFYYCWDCNCNGNVCICRHQT